MKKKFLEPRLKNLIIRFSQLFNKADPKKTKSEYEKIYADFDSEILFDILHFLIPKFFKIEKLIFQDMNIDDLKQDIFLETWNDLREDHDPVGENYLVNKIYSILINLIKENLHQLSQNLDRILDVEANLTIENLIINENPIPIFIIIKKEYFKQLIKIINEELDFTEKSVFIMRFFLELKVNEISDIIDINRENVKRIYRISRLKLMKRISKERLLKYGELVRKFREINRFSDAEELKKLDDFEIFEMRCLENKTTREICDSLNINPGEFRIRLLDFFDNLINPPEIDPPSNPQPDLDIDLNRIMDVIEKTGEHDIDLEKLGTNERSILENFRVLVNMTNIELEFKSLGKYLIYRLSIGTEKIPEKFYQETKLSEIDLEEIIKEKQTPTLEQLHKIEKYFYLPRNYLLGFIKPPSF